MATQNDITGDKIKSKTNSKSFRDNYDSIFNKPPKKEAKDDSKPL